MLIYLIVMLLSVCICWRMQVIRSNGDTLSVDVRKYHAFYCVLLIALLGIVVGFRNGVGTDYGNYTDVYLLTRHKTVAQIFSEEEPLFGLVNMLSAKLFDSYIPMFVFMALVSVALIVYGIYKNSDNYALSVFLLIAGMYYFDLFNGMRQMMAAAIMFAAFPLVKKKKWIPVILLTLIAAGFHSSVYIVLFAFLYSTYVNPRSWYNIILIGAFFAAFIFFDSFSEVLIDLLVSSESRYATFESTLQQSGLGANVLRFGLTAVPVIFPLVLWRYLSQRGKDAGILVNLSLINSGFMLVATRNWIFARFCMFFGIFNILLWPKILSCFEGKSKRFMTFGVICVYFVYFWLIVHTDSNLLPYRSWIFGGVYG